MESVKISHLRENIYKYLDSVINGDILRVETKKGTAMVLSESDYKNMLKAVYKDGKSKKIIEKNLF